MRTAAGGSVPVTEMTIGGGARERFGARVRRVSRLSPRDALTAIAVLLLAVVLLMAVWPQLFSPFDPLVGEPAQRLQPPSPQHLAGTDYLGRDVFTRTIYGARLSLLPALAVVFSAAVIGTSCGLLAGYVTGWVDELLMRFTDIFLAVPALILAMAIATALGPSVPNAALAVVIVWWPGYARLARAEAQVAREQEYVESARAVGATGFRIVTRHVFPNIVSSLIVKLSLDAGTLLLVLAGLSFLGVGAQAPTAEWGLEVATAGQYMFDSPWYLIAPSAAIFVTVFSMNVLGDSVRERLDPRIRDMAGA